MDHRFLPHNTHLDFPEQFSQLDPHLRLLGKQPLVHKSHLLDVLPRNKPGIFTLSGGRQIGKTTLMKQWMAEQIMQGMPPDNIRYITGELIDDHHALVRMFSDMLSAMPEAWHKCLILDEVTYVREWDKAVKYLADAGFLEKVGLFLTGSDMALIREARMRFPGRRGTECKVDFHLYPLNFLETVQLKKRFSSADIDTLLNGREDHSLDLMDRLFQEFEWYLIHGGFLTAMNDLEEHGFILPATYYTYTDWIRGDFLKRGRREKSLQEILRAISKSYGSQATWNSLTQEMSIDHPKTVADHVGLLESMDVVFVLHALIEDKLSAAPKKARKIFFCDPFIYHCARSWLWPCSDPYSDQTLPLLADSRKASLLVESCAASLYGRNYPTYYIKARSEVDIAYVHEERFWPVEVKWTSQLRPGELKQIVKYKNGLILNKSRRRGSIQNVPTEPLPLALLRLGRPGWNNR